MSNFPSFDEMLRGINKLTLNEMYRLNKILARKIRSIQRTDALIQREHFKTGDNVKFFEARPIAGKLERTGKIVKLGQVNAHISIREKIWKVPFNRLVKA